MTAPRPDFWARRKAAVAAEDRAEAARTEANETQAIEEVQAERPEAEVLAEHGLCPPEDVRTGEDLRGFMARTVPEYLRRRALRTLWRSNPVLSCLDGLNDYDGDFTNAATDAPGLVTSYRVGKGLQAHLDALTRKAEALAEDVAPEDVPVEDEGDGPVLALDTVPAEEPAAAPQDAEEGEIPRRRMAFHFDGEAS